MLGDYWNCTRFEELNAIQKKRTKIASDERRGVVSGKLSVTIMPASVSQNSPEFVGVQNGSESNGVKRICSGKDSVIQKFGAMKFWIVGRYHS